MKCMLFVIKSKSIVEFEFHSIWFLSQHRNFRINISISLNTDYWPFPSFQNRIIFSMKIPEKMKWKTAANNIRNLIEFRLLKTETTLNIIEAFHELDILGCSWYLTRSENGMKVKNHLRWLLLHENEMTLFNLTLTLFYNFLIHEPNLTFAHKMWSKMFVGLFFWLTFWFNEVAGCWMLIAINYMNTSISFWIWFRFWIWFWQWPNNKTRLARDISKMLTRMLSGYK